MTETAITIDEMVREAKRELIYRRTVFAQAAREGRMNAREAERRIAVQQAIVLTLSGMSELVQEP